MAVIKADAIITSDMSGIGEVPLDAEVNVDDAEYARIMRRIGLAEGEPETSVSAFNSSI
jgi:hypothetical protein